MGRIPREFYLSGLYHVYNRGNNRINVFPDSEDKEIFLNLINFYRERFGFKVYAVCLMDNHYHMIVETNRMHNISRVIHALKLAYSIRYRRKYKYVGHLWQSRFKSRVIEREKYFFECIEYIHDNPVKAKIAEFSSDYHYSSAGVYKGKDVLVGGCLSVDSFAGTLYS